MSEVYNYGIDLGTTNSCISTVSSNRITIFQNLDNMNVTPSAVYIGKNGRKLVGRRAYDKMIIDPENTATEFKRLMGVNSIKKFKSSGIELSPVELSAEILKTLKEDVYRQNNSMVEYAIITVPAAFGIVQCEDTYKAAELAGFKNVLLLQEPIAAAIAYGAEKGSKDQHWIVFDFGGGTLDIAIVSTYDGRLSVINHEGDNYLGGKNIDEAVYKNVILPVLKEKFRLPDDPNKLEYIHRKLLIAAEDAKKALSTTSSVDIDIFDICDDKNGTPIECRINLTRDKFDSLIRSTVDRCLSLCEKAISESNIPLSSFNRILLVGGTTLIPAVREGLTNHFCIPLDYSIDPMTVVSRGAAIYGTTCRVPEKDGEYMSYPDDGILVKLEYTPATSDDTSNVIGRLITKNNSIKYGQVKIDETSNIWTSGWIDFIDEDSGIFDVDVVLSKNTINSFLITARSKVGENLLLIDNTFTIRHQDEVLITSAPPIPHSVCVELYENEKSILERMIIKGTLLPAKDIKKFKANKTIKPNSNDYITIKIWEGEEIDHPELNQWVGNIYIRSEGLTRPIPEGFDIEVSVSIDESRQIHVSAYVPHIDLFISGELLYDSTRERVDVRKPMQLIGNDIRVLYSKIEEIKDEANINSVIEKAEAYEKELHDIDLEYMDCHELMGLDDDRVIQLLKKFNLLRAKVAELEARNYESNRENIEINEIDRIRDTIQKFGDEDDINEFEELDTQYSRIDSDSRSRGKQHYKDKMLALQAKVLLNDPQILKYWIMQLCDPNKAYFDESQAMHWKEKGFIAAQNNDVLGMREALFNLSRLSGQDTISTLSERELPPDLRRR